MSVMGTETAELRHLKRVSRIKHQILTRYVPSWAIILGSTFDLLYYVDCFAGPGRYESDGEQVDGSPIIVVKAGKEFATKNSSKKLGVVLVDDDLAQLQAASGVPRLNIAVSHEFRGTHVAGRLARPYPQNYRTDQETSHSAELLSS